MNTECIHTNYETSDNLICRLCSGQLKSKFKARILRKYDIDYFECQNCRSLQTERPFWIDEAYDHNLSNLDTGAAQRNLQNLSASFIVSKLFRLTNAIDFGGGDGFLCRLLRDYGINCFVKDKYATPTYAQGFVSPDFHKPDLVTAFEVIEHFTNPSTDLNNIFQLNPDCLLVSTSIYSKQQSDWWYLSTESGQHVFFYSVESIKLIAKKYGYESLISGGYILFVKTRLISPFNKFMANFFLKRAIVRLVRAFILILPTRGVWSDHMANKAKS
jgi:hypothetical protein